MATNFPSSLDTSTQQPTISSTDEMDDSGKEHDVVHTNHSGAIIALETKLGTGDSNATANAVLMGTGSGTSEWDTSPTFKGAVTVGVNDTGHDVIFYGATADDSWFWWDESDDALKLGPSSPLYLDGVKLSEGSADTLRIDSGDGTVDIGPQNTSGCHFYTNTENIYFGTTPSGGSQGVDVVITDTAMYPYTNDALDLGLSTKYWNRTYTDFLYVYNEIIAADGSSGDPSYCFSSDNSAGMYLVSSGTLGWSIAAAELYMNATSLYPAYNEGLELGKSGNVWNHFWLGQASTFSSGGYYTLRSRDSDRQVMEYVSSERYKKDIEDLPLEEAYQILDARPIKFRGLEDDETVPLEAGLSAESLHDAGYEYAVRYDEGHWGETPRGIYYDQLVSPLIKIVKDLKERIEVLED